MTAVSKSEHPLVANGQANSSVVLLPERELFYLRANIKALRKDLRLVFSSNRELEPSVEAAHALLKTWNMTLDRILTAKQAKETSAGLRNWDNEGGAVHHDSTRHSFSGTDTERQPPFSADDNSLRVADSS